MENKFDILYVAMVLTIVGQCTCGQNVFLGQGLFLIANLIYVIRDFALGRPRADKIKNIMFTGITIGIIVMNIL